MAGFQVSEPTFVIGYNTNPNAVGFYELKRSGDKDKMETELERITAMSLVEKAKLFDCTAKQAEDINIVLTSIYPIGHLPEVETIEDEAEDVKA